MSNEYKDWLADKMQDVILDRGLADKVFYPEGQYIEGIKGVERVRFEVWFDEELGNWMVERRELEI